MPVIKQPATNHQASQAYHSCVSPYAEISSDDTYLCEALSVKYLLCCPGGVSVNELTLNAWRTGYKQSWLDELEACTVVSIKCWSRCWTDSHSYQPRHTRHRLVGNVGLMSSRSRPIYHLIQNSQVEWTISKERCWGENSSSFECSAPNRWTVGVT